LAIAIAAVLRVAVRTTRGEIMRAESWVAVTAVCLIVSGVAASAEPQQCRRSMLPANVELYSDLSRPLQHIYDRSATFRSQCESIAGASNLRVRVFIKVRFPSHCRAFTIVRRQGFQIRADVYLPPSSDHSELLAHEFEHLLEQIEGLNLRRLARVRGSGVRTVEGEWFESDRAQAAGRVVTAEVRAFRAPATD
jgi:hypothetical protein